jgi:hypothetical protein
MTIRYYKSNFFVIITVTISIIILLSFGLIFLSTFAENHTSGFLFFGIVFFALGVYQFMNFLSLVKPKKVTISFDNFTLNVEKWISKKSFKIQEIRKCEIIISERIKNIYSTPKWIEYEYDSMKYTMLDFFGINRGITFIIHLNNRKIIISKIAIRHHKDLLQLQTEILNSK